MHSVNTLPDDSEDGLEDASRGSNLNGKMEQNEEKGPIAKESLIKNWPLMSSIILYCVFSLHDMAYTEVPLIAIYIFADLSIFVVYCLSIARFSLITILAY